MSRNINLLLSLLILSMAMHKLCVDDFDQESYTLLAVICRLEDYRMAYMFNKFLDVKFKKRSKNIDFKSPYASYSFV